MKKLLTLLLVLVCSVGFAAGTTVTDPGASRIKSVTFLAYKSANQTVSSATEVDVTFPNEYFDDSGAFDGAATFTAPIAGRYRFRTATINDVTAGGYIWIKIYIAGATHGYGYTLAPSAGTFIVTADAWLDMAAGQKASVTTQQGTGADITVAGSTIKYTFFYGERMLVR